jgi:DNA-nicking Smr family endonuclease
VVKKEVNPLLEDQLFRQEMTGVTPLKTAPTTDSKAPRPKIRERNPEISSDIVDPAHQSSAGKRTHINTEDGSSHRKNGIQKRTLQKLKRGRFIIGAELDLHNMSMETAHSALFEFITAAQSRSLESVRIIHGKGLHSEDGPRLKHMTRQFLRDHPQVLAYTACKPSDGGAGAVDVLLKSA